MKKNIVKKGRKMYFVFNGKAIPFKKFDENGNPIIEPKIEKRGKNVVVKIPSLTIKSKKR